MEHIQYVWEIDDAAFGKEVDDFFNNNKSNLVNHTSKGRHDEDYEETEFAAYSSSLPLTGKKSLVFEDPAEVEGRAAHVAKIMDVCTDESSASGITRTLPPRTETLSKKEVAFGTFRKISNEYMSNDEHKITTTFNSEAPYELDELTTSNVGFMPSVKSPGSRYFSH